MVDDGPALPAGVRQPDSPEPYLRELSARVVEQLVVERRVGAETLLTHPAERVVEHGRGVCALHAVAEVSVEGRARAVVAGAAHRVVVVVHDVPGRIRLRSDAARLVVALLNRIRLPPSAIHPELLF